MSHLRLKYLLDKYLSNKISFEEEEELFDLLTLESFDISVKEYLLKAYYKSIEKNCLNDSRSEKMLASILHTVDHNINTKKSHWNFSRISWAAALLVITAGILIFYTLSKRNKYNDALEKRFAQTQLKNDVDPGTNGAILKLADGSQVVLDSNNNRTTIRQGNTLVINDAGSLNYINNNKTKNGKNFGYNLVETQRGHQFHLSLEDGTKVWLNASSTISFPVEFAGNERDVKITGEVYFEVAKNKKKPFHVYANGTIVEVLGTHFNINSYKDNGAISTTLLEGSVKISSGNNHRVLKPGEQASVLDNGLITTVSNINTDEIVAWKNDYFSFDNTDIRRVMMQLSRWYDVEVDFKGNIDDSVTFNGTISRSVNLSTVLKMLQTTGEVTFSIEGKKVTVSM